MYDNLTMKKTEMRNISKIKRPPLLLLFSAIFLLSWQPHLPFSWSPDATDSTESYQIALEQIPELYFNANPTLEEQDHALLLAIDKENEPSQPYYLSWGETIAGLLAAQGLSNRLTFNIVAEFTSRGIELDRWRTSDPVQLIYDQKKKLVGINLTTLTNEVTVHWDSQGLLSGETSYRSLSQEEFSKSVVIKTSMFVDGVAAGIDEGILMELLGLFSFDVDLQRDIYPGNRFEVLYTMLKDEKGQLLRYGEILYASLETANDKVYSYTLFENLHGERNYYSNDGRSVRKALMRTPINGAYISSSFGLRNNPTRRGYTDFHTGIDFAAPRGTPIYAAGSGKIAVRGWSRKGYGNYIKVDHPNGYSTLYAHLSAFRSGQRIGSRVEQGEVIGYVGSTGNSTGNHLHYEVYYQQKVINPLTLKLPPADELNISEKTLFNKLLKAYYSEIGSEFLLFSPDNLA